MRKKDVKKINAIVSVYMELTITSAKVKLQTQDSTCTHSLVSAVLFLVARNADIEFSAGFLQGIV